MTTRNMILLEVLGFVGLVCYLRSNRRRRKKRRLVEKLNHHAEIPERKTVDFTAIDYLPTPVAKYFRFALRESQPLLASACISQLGTLRVSESQRMWRRFRAVEHVSAVTPSFVWDAQISFPLGMSIEVRDAYIDGCGVAEVDAFSLLTLAKATPSFEMAQGELMRYLAEAVWFPTALLPSAGVIWSPIDDTTALATLADGDLSISLEFRFNEIGEVTGVYSPCRYREVGGTFEPTPWEGFHREYEEMSGMMIPTKSEVCWHLPSGKFTVWKGTIKGINHHFLQ